MIQGGDPPAGNGGPGYKFVDEFHPDCPSTRPACSRWRTPARTRTARQFFITVAPTPRLNTKHTIFGEVTEGMGVVEKIGNAPKGAQDRPEKPVKITSISVK